MSLALRMAAAMAGGVSSDPYWSSVKLLAHFDNNWNDSKGLHNLTTTNAVLSATQSKFGGYAMYSDGNGDRAITDSSADFAFGTGDLTIEMWIFCASTQVATDSFLMKNNVDSNTWTANKWSIHNKHSSSANLTFWVYNISSSAAILNAGMNINDNAWHHIAITRSGTRFDLWVDGISKANTTSSAAIDGGTTQPISIGNSNTANASFTGYVDDVRITKGVCRYTSSFTPPTMTFPNA